MLDGDLEIGIIREVGGVCDNSSVISNIKTDS